MNKKTQARNIVAALEKTYPDAICSLAYVKPHELLIATRLAAQCTDARVNIVTRTLYKVYPTLEAFAEASVDDVTDIVRPCGLGPTKARDIVAMSKMLVEEYGGVVPDTVEELLKLPGVGRKTANLVVGDIYHKPAVVCDTHCIRITNLMGLTDSKNALIVERQLREILDPEKSNDFCHRLVLHGRAVCVARSPKCDQCCVRGFCTYGKADDKKKKRAG
ncbi:MAG: endonuclease III [Oscillospiraceae bacterium]|nr:endonuclease III [Oscillospiraceae bacterium]